MASLKTCGFIALDGMDSGAAKALMAKLQGQVLGIKLNDLLDEDACGLLMRCRFEGYLAWADAKLHDIPATVANRVSKLASYGADIITVHASGGSQMIKAAVAAYRNIRQEGGMGIAAVTVLTSLTGAECEAIYGDDPVRTAYRLGQNADFGGAFGIVCSPQEVESMKKEFPRLKRFTPGIRSSGIATHDHNRVDTPANALSNGADYLVIGREVTQAADPLEAIRRIDTDIAHLP